MIKTLDLLKENQINSIPQDETLVTFAYNILPKEERLDFQQKSLDIYNHVRAFNPWPVTHFTIDDLKIKVYEIEIIEMAERYRHFTPGEVVDIVKGDVYVKTLDGVIKIKTIQPAGKNVMPMNAFMNGFQSHTS